MEKILNLIDGKLTPPINEGFFENINPATNQPYSLVPDSDFQDVEKAASAAREAFPSWSKLTNLERSRFLKKIAEGISKNLDLLARAESIDNGKPISLARDLDIPRAQQNFEFFAEQIINFKGETFHTEDRALNETFYSPLGVVACISPWNLPLYLFTWKIAPALAAGNTVIAKPSEITPMTSYLLSKIVIESGLPKGVLNILHGTGPKLGDPLVRHPLVKAVSFTGSTATGRAIAKATAGTFKKLSLEMGGKNANIVFSDCDFEKALDTSVRSSFLNQGQICLCNSRILVEKTIYHKFRDALVEKVKNLKVGDPLSPDTQQGSIVSKAQFEKNLNYLEIAKKEGGKILCGGQPVALPPPNHDGFFLAPTLIEGLSNSCQTNQDEIFGPIATIMPFESEVEALQLANETRYGLSASIWSRDLEKAKRVALGLEVGVAWINTWMLRDLRTPFGGVKESGVGREGGVEALKFFSEVKNVCVAKD